MITSNQNSKLKLVRSLMGRSRDRHEAGAFVAEGVRLIEEAFSAGWPARFVLYTAGLSERAESLVEKYRAAGVDVEQVSADLLQHISETESPQGLLAVLEEQAQPLPEQPDFLLIPDQIRDPGNLGTLMRSAAAAGVQAVIVPPATVDPFSPKVLRSAMGAHFRLPVRSMSWPEITGYIEQSKLDLFLADMEGASCWETALVSPLALMIGSEADGASADGRGLTHQKISIPMLGKTESLNAGIAGSILMFEVMRQRSGLKT